VEQHTSYKNYNVNFQTKPNFISHARKWREEMIDNIQDSTTNVRQIYYGFIYVLLRSEFLKKKTTSLYIN